MFGAHAFSGVWPSSGGASTVGKNGKGRRSKAGAMAARAESLRLRRMYMRSFYFWTMVLGVFVLLIALYVGLGAAGKLPSGWWIFGSGGSGGGGDSTTTTITTITTTTTNGTTTSGAGGGGTTTVPGGTDGPTSTFPSMDTKPVTTKAPDSTASPGSKLSGGGAKMIIIGVAVVLVLIFVFIAVSWWRAEKVMTPEEFNRRASLGSDGEGGPSWELGDLMDTEYEKAIKGLETAIKGAKQKAGNKERNLKMAIVNYIKPGTLLPNATNEEVSSQFQLVVVEPYRSAEDVSSRLMIEAGETTEEASKEMRRRIVNAAIDVSAEDRSKRKRGGGTGGTGVSGMVKRIGKRLTPARKKQKIEGPAMRVLSYLKDIPVAALKRKKIREILEAAKKRGPRTRRIVAGEMSTARQAVRRAKWGSGKPGSSSSPIDQLGE